MSYKAWISITIDLDLFQICEDEITAYFGSYKKFKNLHYYSDTPGARTIEFELSGLKNKFTFAPKDIFKGKAPECFKTQQDDLILAMLTKDKKAWEKCL